MLTPQKGNSDISFNDTLLNFWLRKSYLKMYTWYSIDCSEWSKNSDSPYSWQIQLLNIQTVLKSTRNKQERVIECWVIAILKSDRHFEKWTSSWNMTAILKRIASTLKQSRHFLIDGCLFNNGCLLIDGHYFKYFLPFRIVANTFITLIIRTIQYNGWHLKMVTFLNEKNSIYYTNYNKI